MQVNILVGWDAIFIIIVTGLYINSDDPVPDGAEIYARDIPFKY